MVRVQDDHPATNQALILNRELSQKYGEFEMNSSAQSIDQCIINKMRLEKKLEELESEIEAWRLTRSKGKCGM